MGRLALLFRLSLRNVWRHARQSVLTSAAMVLGLALMILSRTLADGAHEDWIDAGVRMGTGHVALQAPSFLATGRIEDRLSGDERRVAEAAAASPEMAPLVRAVVPMLSVQGLATTPAGAVPVMIVGLPPETGGAVSLLAERRTEGRYLEPGVRLQAYVGQRLADRLNLELGSRLVLTAQDAHGEIVGQLERVTGIFRMGLPEVDEGVINLPLAAVQEWLGLGDGVTTVALLLESSRDVSRVVEALEARLGDQRDAIRVLSWQAAMPELDAAVRVDDWGDYIFHGILFAIIALAIVNTMLMAVLYRTRELGLLRALGLNRLETAGVIFGEGLLLTMASGIVGLVLGLAGTWLFFRNGLDYSFLMDQEFTIGGIVLDPVIVPVFRASQLLQSLGYIIVIGLGASFYPAYRATRIDMAEAMKFEA